MEKERLDVLLVQKGHFESREKARGTIMAGFVYIDGNKEDKPGSKFNINSNIEVRGNSNPFVSRGGLKLQKALKEFSLDLTNRTAMDIGASTGGFTDCMLKSNAKKVYSIDVGYGQLAWQLRSDDRVVVMDRTNIRYVKPENFDEDVTFASIDVSFISLKKVLPVLKEIIKLEGDIVCLIKPQFEAGRDKVGKNGVVRDKETHLNVIMEIINFSLGMDFYVKNLSFSPIKGPEGNIEYLLHLSINRFEEGSRDFTKLANDIVNESHNI